MIESAFRAVNELGDIQIRTGEIRHRRKSGTQPNLTRDGLVLRRLIELTLKPRDQKPGAGGVRIRRENGKPRITHVPDDVGLPALLAEHVRNVCEPGRTFFPQHARPYFAILHLRCDRDAGKRLVLSEGARAELASQLAQAESGIEASRSIHEILGPDLQQLAARAQECFELDENRLEIHRMTAILPRARGERGHARVGVDRRRRRDHDGYRVIVRRAISDRETDVECFYVSERFI